LFRIFLFIFKKTYKDSQSFLRTTPKVFFICSKWNKV